MRIFVSKIKILLIDFSLKSNFLPAPTRAAVPSQPVPVVGERLMKSKIIPDQARALANALKHAVVKPLKKSMMTKKKSIEIPSNEQQIIPSISTPPSTIVDNSDHTITETSVDSLESTTPIALTPPPAKPPRHGDESGSSSPTETNSAPAKPPRHFSLYSNNNNDGLIQQTDNVVKKVLNLVDTFGSISENDNDMNILRQTSPPPPPIYIQQPSNTNELDNLKSVERFTVDPSRVPLNTDSPIITKPLDEPITLTPSSPFPPLSTDLSFSPIIESKDIITDNNSTPIEITQLATNLTDNIFGEIEKEFQKQTKSTDLDTIINEDRQNLLDKLSTQSPSTNTTFRDNAPTLPQSIATTHPSSAQSNSRPLMFVSLDSGFNITKAFSPLLDVITTKTTPKITTSVTVISPPQPEVTSTTTNINSDEEEQLNSTSTLMPNSSIASDRSKFLQTSSKESSIDSTDTNPYESTTLQQHNTGSATPARSLISDYDNLHGSYGSLNDDTQQQSQLPPPPPASTSSETNPSVPTTTSSSISTIYESFDTLHSSSTPTYVTAKSTLNNDNTSDSVTSAKRLNSDISDEDLVESYDIETPILTSVNPFRTSKGRIASYYIQINKHEHTFIRFSGMFSPSLFFFLCSDRHDLFKCLFYYYYLFSKNNNNKKSIYLSIYIYHIASTPIIEIIEDDSEPADECDMSFLSDILQEYNHNIQQQGLRTRMFKKKCVRMKKYYYFYFI